MDMECLGMFILGILVGVAMVTVWLGVQIADEDRYGGDE